MSIYDWNCAELIHDYVELHFDDFSIQNIEFDCCELEYAERNFIDFRDWASALGYEITR
jgi:hypothetical protein